MVLRMCIHRDNMAGISEGIDLRNYPDLKNEYISH